MSTIAATRFALLGEPLALDLVNTRVCRHGAELDLLDSPRALAAWLRAERGRVAWHGRSERPDLVAVRALRDAIRALLDAAAASVRPAAGDIATLNAALADGRATPARLAWRGGQPRLVAVRAGAPRRVLLHVIAADAAALLTGADAKRVRQCAHPDCILRFVAHNPRRRWCCAATCGNRARVARHYLRRHEAD